MLYTGAITVHGTKTNFGLRSVFRKSAVPNDRDARAVCDALVVDVRGCHRHGRVTTRPRLKLITDAALYLQPTVAPRSCGIRRAADNAECVAAFAVGSESSLAVHAVALQRQSLVRYRRCRSSLTRRCCCSRWNTLPTGDRTTAGDDLASTAAAPLRVSLSRLHVALLSQRRAVPSRASDALVV